MSSYACPVCFLKLLETVMYVSYGQHLQIAHKRQTRGVSLYILFCVYGLCRVYIQACVYIYTYKLIDRIVRRARTTQRHGRWQ